MLYRACVRGFHFYITQLESAPGDQAHLRSVLKTGTVRFTNQWSKLNKTTHLVCIYNRKQNHGLLCYPFAYWGVSCVHCYPALGADSRLRVSSWSLKRTRACLYNRVCEAMHLLNSAEIGAALIQDYHSESIATWNKVQRTHGKA